LAWSSQELRGFCESQIETKGSQVVRISSEDAISRKAVGSPDWLGNL
jgi:hypothetical protein